MTKQKPSFKFDKPLIIPEKWIKGVSNLQVYKTVYNITERNNRIQHYIPSTYEQERVNFEISLTFLKQYTPEYILQLKTDLANENENIMEIKSEYGIEEYTYHLSDLDYALPRKNNIEGLKRMKYGRHYIDEDLDMYYRMQLTIDEN